MTFIIIIEVVCNLKKSRGAVKEEVIRGNLQGLTAIQVCIPRNFLLFGKAAITRPGIFLEFANDLPKICLY